MPAAGGASSTGDPSCIALPALPVQKASARRPPIAARPSKPADAVQVGGAAAGHGARAAAGGAGPRARRRALGPRLPAAVAQQARRPPMHASHLQPPSCARHQECTAAAAVPLHVVVCMSRKGVCFDLGLIHIGALQPCDGVRATGRLCAAQHTGRIQGCLVQVVAPSMSERTSYCQHDNATPVRPLHILRLFLWIQAQ